MRPLSPSPLEKSKEQARFPRSPSLTNAGLSLDEGSVDARVRSLFEERERLVPEIQISTADSVMG